MSEMIERVARTLSPQSWEALGTPCDTKAKKKRREISLDYARRCIKAMREPTGEMIEAGHYVEDSDGFNIGSTSAKEVWQAMIDAILK